MSGHDPIGMTSDPVHTRLAAWQAQIRAAMASQRLDLPFATCVITDDLPDVWDLNLLSVTAPVPPALLLRSIEKIAESAQWAHRRIEIDDPGVAARLRAPLVDAGYSEQRLVTMALADHRRVAGDAQPTAVVDIEQQRDLGRAVTAQEPWADSDELLDQMTERERRLAHVAGGQAIIAPPDAPVSRCLLLTDGVLAEIDAVATLTAHRGRGWSRAVVQRAISAARDLDVDDIVLVADDDDWPMAWYERLGFAQVGHSFAYQRVPEQRRP